MHGYRELDICQTIRAGYGAGGGNIPIVLSCNSKSNCQNVLNIGISKANQSVESVLG